jgi:hypothetical protein
VNTQEALQKLEDLPTTAAIADELVSMGIKATPRKSEHCAIAYYLQETTGQQVAVGLHTAIHGDGEAMKIDGVVVVAGGHGVGPAMAVLLDYERRSLTMPQVGRFISEFDEGKYPKLVAD